MALQISTQSAKMGRPHRLSGMSLVRDLHETQETLHRLGVPREEKHVVTDIITCDDSNCLDSSVPDGCKPWRLGPWATGLKDLNHEGSKRQLQRMNENGIYGNWCTGPGKRGERWNGAAKVNAHFILKVDGVPCWGTYRDESIRTASATERGGMGEGIVKKGDLPSDVQEILRK